MHSQDPLADLSSFAAGLAAVERDSAGLLLLEQAAGTLFGHRLFSVMLHDAEARWNARVHSSRPEQYPVGGRKPVRDTAWSHRLFVLGQPWLCSDPAELRATFPDHRLIQSLGCGAALNLPVRWRGQTIGTVNLLDAAGSYAATDFAAGQVLAALAVPLLQAWRRTIH